MDIFFETPFCHRSAPIGSRSVVDPPPICCKVTNLKIGKDVSLQSTAARKTDAHVCNRITPPMPLLLQLLSLPLLLLPSLPLRWNPQLIHETWGREKASISAEPPLMYLLIHTQMTSLTWKALCRCEGEILQEDAGADIDTPAAVRPPETIATGNGRKHRRRLSSRVRQLDIRRLRCRLRLHFQFGSFFLYH